jgi:hypothetical protein
MLHFKPLGYLKNSSLQQFECCLLQLLKASLEREKTFVLTVGPKVFNLTANLFENYFTHCLD